MPDTPALLNLTRAPDGLVGSWLDALADRVAVEAEGLAPVGDGKDGSHLFQEIKRTDVHTVSDGVAVEVGSDKRYTAAVVLGARPHVIVPRQAAMLRFTTRDGTVVYAKRVNHPGNKANNFLMEAAAHLIPGA